MVVICPYPIYSSLTSILLISLWTVFAIFYSEKTWCYLLFSCRSTVIVFQKSYLLTCLKQCLYRIIIFCFSGCLFSFSLLILHHLSYFYAVYGLMHVVLYSIGTQYHLSSDMEVQLLKFIGLWKRYECHQNLHLVAYFASYIFRFCHKEKIASNAYGLRLSSSI